MRIQKAVLAVCSMWLCAVSYAGGSTGGGNVVICQDPGTNLTTIRLLDYYEAEVLMPELKPALGGGATELDQVNHVLDRLEKIDKNRALSYRATAAEFIKQTRFVDRVKLPDINDHAYVPLETHCKIEQIAVQNISPFPQAKKYTVRREYWDKLSVSDRAGLILHEVIYEEALANGEKNSRGTRYFNALVSSERVSKLTAEEYAQRLRLVGLEKSSVPDELLIIENPIQFRANAGVPFAQDLSEYVLPKSKTLTFSYLYPTMSWITVHPSGKITGTPTVNDVGRIEIDIRVTDGKTMVNGKVLVNVVEDVVPSLPSAKVGEAYEYSLLKHNPFAKGQCTFLKAYDLLHVVNSKWLSMDGPIRVVGTPTAADAGFNQFKVTFECTAQKKISITNPDGTITEKTVPEIRTKEETFSLTVTDQGKFTPGTPVPAGEMDEVVAVDMPNAKCVANIVGKKVAILPAHCTSRDRGILVHKGKNYGVIFVMSPHFATRDHDLAVAISSSEFVDAKPLSVSTVLAKVGATFDLLLMNRAASPETRVRMLHEVKQVAENRYQTISQDGLPSAVAGTSGSAFFTDWNKREIASMVTSVSISPDGEYGPNVFSTPLASQMSQTFLKDVASAQNVEICGVNATCN